MTTHNGNLNRSKVDAKPEAGTRQPKGKSSECDAVLRTGLQPKPEKVRELSFEDPNKGTAHRAAQNQIEGEDGVENGNPKRRTANSWGVKEKK